MSNTPEALFRIADINAKIKSYEQIHRVYTKIYWKNLIHRFAFNIFRQIWIP